MKFCCGILNIDWLMSNCQVHSNRIMAEYTHAPIKRLHFKHAIAGTEDSLLINLFIQADTRRCQVKPSIRIMSLNRCCHQMSLVSLGAL